MSASHGVLAWSLPANIATSDIEFISLWTLVSALVISVVGIVTLKLLAEVWSWSFGDTSTVTVHVRRLREKLEADPTLPRRIVTVWGVGYRYEPEAA